MNKNKKTKNVFLKNGFELGKYVILKKISNGGFGVVYLAKRYDGQLVAIKEFLPSVIPCRNNRTYPHIKCFTKQNIKRFNKGLKSFFSEADKLSQIHDEKIISIWDVFKSNGTAYIVMPFEKGDTLQHFIVDSKMYNYHINEHFLVLMFIDVCKALEKMHKNGLLHLDIKPGNIWLRPNNNVLVLDLGAAKWEDDEMNHKHMAKTPGFAAPEQHDFFKKKKTVSYQTDVYGVCSTFLSCLLRHPPLSAQKRQFFYENHNEKQLYKNHNILYSCFSTKLINVLDKGMSICPNMRHNSITNLRYDLEKVEKILRNENNIMLNNHFFAKNKQNIFISSSPL